MAKRKNNQMAFEDFEAKAKEFISLTLNYCEEELGQIRVPYPLPNPPKYQALPAAALSVQQSIKAFLAILQISNE